MSPTSTLRMLLTALAVSSAVIGGSATTAHAGSARALDRVPATFVVVERDDGIHADDAGVPRDADADADASDGLDAATLDVPATPVVTSTSAPAPSPFTPSTDDTTGGGLLTHRQWLYVLIGAALGVLLLMAVPTRT